MAAASNNIVAQWEQLNHQFAKVADGVTLHYIDVGPRDATPVVLVHGWPDLAFTWRVRSLRLITGWVQRATHYTEICCVVSFLLVLCSALQHQIGPLSEKFRVIAPDLRGFGRSSAPREVEAYGSKIVTSDLAKLLGVFAVCPLSSLFSS